MRSAQAVEFLRTAGFRKVWNLKGGILAWSDTVDPSVPKYWPRFKSGSRSVFIAACTRKPNQA
jgi:predicted sulfurtransferase